MSRSIIHLSDVHFGSEHATSRASALLAAIRAIRPDVVVVSGDLTQRARRREFEEARRFLEAIEAPCVVVPGNHDVPLWNLAKRFVAPLAGWRRWLRTDPTPRYVDDEVAIVGIDTTRRFGVKGGSISRADLDDVARHFDATPARVCRIVVGHHPVATLERHGAGDSPLGARRALARFAALHVEMVLAGHLHETQAFHPVERRTGVKGQVLLINAGTATSNRGRRAEAHVNSFNVVTVLARTIQVTTYLHARQGDGFVALEPNSFRRALREPATSHSM